MAVVTDQPQEWIVKVCHPLAERLKAMGYLLEEA